MGLIGDSSGVNKRAFGRPEAQTWHDALTLGAISGGVSPVISAGDQISLDQGAVGAPTLAFTGDLTTGIWSAAGGSVSLSSLGVLQATFNATGLVLASGATLSQVDTSAGGTRLSMTMTPSGAWGGDLAHLEGVGPNFSGGALLNLKSNDADQSFLTMDNGTADIFSWTQAGVMTYGEGTYRTGSATGSDASDALHDFRGDVNQSGVGGYNFASYTWTHSAVGSGVKRGLYVNAPTGFSGDLIKADVNGAEKFAVSSAGAVDAAGQLTVLYVEAGQYTLSGWNYGGLKYVTDDGLHFVTGADTFGNNNIVICDAAGRSKDFDHDTHSATPTFFWQSARDPDVSNQEWGSATHTGAGFLFSSGPTTGAGTAPTTIDNFIGFAPRGTERVRFDGSGNVIQSALNADPGAGAMVFNSGVSFYIDEAGHNLMVRAKYSDGTAKTGTVCALV